MNGNNKLSYTLNKIL